MRKWREEWKDLSKGIRGLMWHINKLDEYEDTINELKNTVERQEILIDKLKCCGNCKHQGVAEWCNLREEFIHTIGYGEKDCVWKPKEDNV